MYERIDPASVRELHEPFREGHPDVSIVIPAHNEEATLLHALRSIGEACRSFSGRTEVIVVNNASTDATRQYAEGCGVKVVDEERIGVSYARQAGLDVARGDLLLGTDADSVVPERWIETHVRHYDDRRIAGVSGAYRFDRVHGLLSLYKSFRELTPIMMNATHRLWGLLTGSQGRISQSGANFSFRTQIARQVGGYIPGLNKGEDTSLGLRLWAHGSIMRDETEDMTVITSGRRYRALEQSLRYVRDDVLNVLQRSLRAKPRERSREFDAIREPALIAMRYLHAAMQR